MPQQTRSQLRRAENEVVFKDHNNRILHQAENLLPNQNKATFPIGFTCECSDEKCLDTIAITVDLFHNLSANKKRFIVKAGHEQLDIEEVVEQRVGFTVVEKFVTPPKTNGVLNATDSNQ